MQDAVVFAMFNQQGSPRGEREFKVPNWWMGMGQRPLAQGTLTVSLMLSLDPATVGGQGYSHILQVGETYQGNALIDHQHPHEFLMQAAARVAPPLCERHVAHAGGRGRRRTRARTRSRSCTDRRRRRIRCRRSGITPSTRPTSRWAS